MTPLADCAAPLGNVPRLPDDPAKRAEALSLRPIATTARILLRLGRYSKARSLAESALAGARDAGYEPVLAELLTLAGRISLIENDFAKARPLLEEAVRICDAARDDHGRARAMTELVFVQGYGERASAEAHRLARHVDAVLARVGGDAKVELDVTSYEADVYDEASDPAALPLRRRAVALARKVYGPASYVEANHLSGLGATLDVLGQRREAAEAFARAFAIMVATVGYEHPNVGRMLLNLGDLRYHTGDVDGALAAYREALGIQERNLPPASPEKGHTFLNIGQCLLDKGRPDEAAGSFARALPLVEAYGRDAPVVGQVLFGIGRAEIARGRPAEAVAPLERALAIRSAAHAPDADVEQVRVALASARSARR